MESKHEKFLRIATKRTNEVIDKLRILSNCSNKNTYSYSQDEINKIFRAIDQEIRAAKSKFAVKQDKFKL